MFLPFSGLIISTFILVLVQLSRGAPYAAHVQGGAEKLANKDEPPSQPRPAAGEETSPLLWSPNEGPFIVDEKLGKPEGMGVAKRNPRAADVFQGIRDLEKSIMDKFILRKPNGTIATSSTSNGAHGT